MTQKTIKFEYEKETKNSVRYQELPEPGQAPVLGTIYVQKWFASDTKNLTITIEKTD
ncbi:hypothetical protein [Shewanella sp. UCD-KL12]|uniref:hypothetical protein n=1 Tax=Shewanella sp. UCD-KL12 TaxID=1917163 RepID=UPI0015C39DB0|nr:hypothetical protein [Shewanella sp. UCD-KL12]